MASHRDEKDSRNDDEKAEEGYGEGRCEQNWGIHTFFFIIPDATIDGRMPRVSTDETEVIKRAPRRRVAAARAPRKTATVRTKAKEVTPPEPEVAAEVVPRRKAPTKLPLSPASPVALYEASRAKKNLFVSGSLFMLGLAIAAGIGYSDDGVINTASVIAERNAQLAAGVTSTEPGSTSMLIPVQDSASGKVDGGLVSSGEVPPLVPSPTEVATTTGTSTDVASSTNEVPTEESDVEAEVVSEEVTSDTEEAASSEAAATQAPTE